MLNNWNNWCRLCGQENGDRINFFIKDEHSSNITETIEKLFSITINISDEIPQKICTNCYEFVISILNYSKKVIKIQEMFTEIQLDHFTDLEALRIKYNLPIDGKPFVFANDTKVFVESTENDSLKFSIAEEMIKEPKVNTQIGKSAEEIDENNLHNIIDSESCVQVVNETVTVEPEELHSSPHIECIDINDNTKIRKQTAKVTKFKNIRLYKERLLYDCNICKKPLATQSGYRLHMKFKHSIAIAKESYPCDECDKIFQEKRNLNGHKKTHLPAEDRKLHPCPHCDKKFAADWYVNIHVRTVHEKERSYICDECGKTFATNSLLLNHKLVHTDLKPFQCTKCPNSFKCARSLKHHIDTHTDTKYTCSICQVQLNTKKILRLHMVIHSDKKKFKCNFCEKEFKRSKEIKNHLISHMGLKPYDCPFCEQTFANGSNCRKHKKLVHPIELAELEKSGEKSYCTKVPTLEQLQAMTYIKKKLE